MCITKKERKNTKGLCSKFFSAILTVCIVMLSTTAAIFAEATSGALYTDFSTKSAGGYDTGNYYGGNITNSPGIKYEPVTGTFGKSASDSSLHFHNTSEAVASAIVNGNYLQFKSFETQAAENVTGTTHISFQMALDNFESEKNIYMTYSPNDLYQKLISIDTNGVLTLTKRGGTATSYTATLAENKWYKFDVVVNTITNANGVIINKVSVYIDGDLIGKEYEYGYNNFKKVTVLRFESKLVSAETAGSYKETGLYIDNFAYSFYDTAETLSFGAPSLYSDAEYFSAYMENGIYYVNDDSKMVPSALLANINSNLSGYTAAVTDIATGELTEEELSVMSTLTQLNGKYIRLNSTGGAYELFIPIEAEGKTVYYEMNHAPAAAAGTFFTQLDTAYLINQGKDVSCYTFGPLTDVGGRRGSSYGVTTVNATPSHYKETSFYFNLQKTTVAANTLKPFTIEMSFFQKGDIKQTAFMVRGKYNTNTNDDGYPIFISGNGDITVFADTTPLAKKANPNEWNKLAFTVYPVTKTFDLCLNGEKIVDGAAFSNSKNTWELVYDFRATTYYACSENYSANAAVAIDDITMYSGTADEKTVSELNSANLSVEGNVIGITSEETPYTDFISGLSATNGGSFEIYEDSSFTSAVTSGNVTRDSVVVVKSSDDEIYRYYYPDYTKVTISGPQLQYKDGKFVAAMSSTAPKTNKDKVILILAVYNGTVLESLDISKEADINGASLTAEAAADENRTAKAFLWNNLSGIKPLTETVSNK